MEQKFATLQAKIEADNSLVEKLFALQSANEVQDFLKAQGMDFSMEEINILRDGIVKFVEKRSANGELSDADLEDVAGGFAITAAGVTAAAVLITAIGGVALGLGTLGIAGAESYIRNRW